MEKCLNIVLDRPKKLNKRILQGYEVLKIREWQLQFTLKKYKIQFMH